MSKSDETNKLNSDISQLSDTVNNLEQTLKDQIQYANKPTCPVPFPDITTPILRAGGGDTNPEILQKLGPLAILIGTWASSPTTGFCVMPLPEATAPNEFILKNFYYYEEITFSAIEGKVANRGGTFEQDCYTLFYEQRVFFSDQPQKNQLVHAENGSWLHLVTAEQLQGPVGGCPISTPPAPNPIPPQNPERTIAKQVSIPHGNSMLALGNVIWSEGAPDIPEVSTLPIGAPPSYSAPYGSNTPSNPNVNPNIVLTEALKNSAPIAQTFTFFVDSDNDGGIANIPFIKNHADVTQFTNNMWLEQLVTGEWQMQYSQNVSLKFPSTQKGKHSNIVFPHILANTLRRVK